jgi:hypothetical protein
MSRRLSISCAEENIVNGVYNERGLHEGVPLFVKVDGSCLMRIRWESPYHDHDRQTLPHRTPHYPAAGIHVCCLNILQVAVGLGGHRSTVPTVLYCASRPGEAT